LGIPRANNAKDIDWSKVANTISEEVVEKPAPIKIPVSDVLNRVKKPTKLKVVQNVVVNKKGMLILRDEERFCC
jgi:chitinase